jgi:diguanylate cyclase (GGDEF)-like protein
VNSDLLQKILSCRKVPTLPAVALRVIELTSGDDVSMRELAATIQNDQGLASKILRTVNSAFYGLSHPCSTISRAQLMLGLQAIKTLALGFTLVSTLKENEEGEFDYEAYWRRGVFTGVAAKSISTMLHKAEPEEAFLGGLLQDIGMLAMYSALGEEYLKVVRSVGDDHSQLVNAERAAFELHHPSVGAMLAERWRLPASLVAPIKYHERPTAAPKEHADVVKCVGLGNLAATALSSSEPAQWLSKFYQKAEAWFSMSNGQADDLLNTIVDGSREVSKLFDLQIGGKPDVAEILETANERLVGYMLESERELDRVVQQSEDLKRALSIDGLTGLASRRQFLEEFGEAFQQAHRSQDMLHVALIDVDLFRRINDEHGRENGDRVLRAVAERLDGAMAGRRVLLARTGGEEFALLVGGVDRAAMAGLADTCRAALAESPIEIETEDHGTVSVKVTASVGIASLEPRTAEVFSRLERLLNAADQAVRAAKGAGGDCVRLFTPRSRAAA